MADDLQIVISAVLGKNTANELQKELDRISKQLKLTIKNVGVVSQQITSTSGSTQSATKKTTQAINAQSQAINQNIQAIIQNANAYKLLRDSQDNINKIIVQTTNVVNESGNKLKQHISTVYKLVDVQTNEWVKSNSTVSHSMDKIHAEALKVNAALDKLRDKQRTEIDTAIQKTIADRKKEQLILEQNQSIAINKNIEAERRKTAVLREQLQLYKQQMLGGSGFRGELDIFAEKQAGKYDKSALSQIRSDIEKLTITTPDLNNKIKQTKMQFSLLKKEAGETSNVLIKTLENAYKFMRFYLVGGALVGIFRVFRQGIAEVIALDSALTELNKVLDVSTDELVSYTREAYKMGEVLGRTGKEVINATAEFARAGYNLAESSKLAEQAILLTNVAEGLENTAEAAGYLIAVMKGYNLTAQDSVHIVDLLNEVSNNYAVSTLKLAEGLQRTSGTLSQTGTSVEELAGILTAGYEVLRNMEKVSSGLVTISTRLRGISESGEEIDGLMPKLQETFKEFAGIDIQTVNGEMRSTYDILKDLAGVWHTLNDEQKAHIGYLTSGIRQSPVLNAIMLNWQTVEQASKTAMSSTNSAIIENEKYLSSLQGRLNLLSSALSKLAYDTINSQVLKSLIDLATILVKVIDKLGVFEFAIISLIGYFSIFKTSLLLAPIINATTIAISKLTVGLHLSTAAAIKLNTALGLIAPVALATGIILLVKALRGLNTSMSDLSQEVNENYNEFQSNLESIKNLKKEYEELSKVTDLNRDQKLRLIEIERELKTRYGETTKELDLQNKSLEENSRIIDKATREEAERFLLLNKRAYEKAKKLLSEPYTYRGHGFTQEFESIEKAIKHFKELLINSTDKSDYVYNIIKKSLEDLYKEYDNAIDTVDKCKSAEEFLKAVLDDVNDSLEEQVKSVFNVYQNTEELNKSTSKITETIEDLAKAYATLNEGRSLSVKEILDLVEKYPQLQSAMKVVEGQLYLEKDAILVVMKAEEMKFKEQLKIWEQEAINVRQSLLNKLSSYGEEVKSIEDVISARKKLADSYYADTRDLGINIVGAAQMYIKLLSDFDTVSKELQNIEDRIKRFQLLGGVDFTNQIITGASSSAKSIKEIAQYLSDELAKAIEEVNGKLTASNVKLSQYDEASEEYRRELEYQIELQKQLQSLYHQGANQLRARNEAIRKNSLFQKNWNSLTDEQKEKLNELKKELDDNEKAIQNFGNSWWSAQNAINSATDAIQKSIDAVKSLISDMLQEEKALRLESLRKSQEQIIENLQKMIDSTKTFDLDSFKQAVQDIVSQFDIIDQKFVSGASFLTDTSKARRELQFYKNDIISLADEAERFINSTSNSQRTLENIIRSQVSFANNLQSELKSINNLIAEKTRLYKDQEIALEKQIEEVSNEYDKQIELQDEKLKLLEKEVDAEERKRRLLEINEELERALRDKRFEYITKEGERILTYDKGKVDELRKRQEELVKQFKREDLQKAIKDEIELIQKAKNEELEILRKKLEDTKNIHNAEIESLRLYANSLQQIHSSVISNTNDKINKLKELQDQERENLEKHWDNFIRGVLDGTISYDEIMDVWYDESFESLKKYVDNVSSQLERLKKLWKSLKSIRPEGMQYGGGGASGTGDTFTIEDALGRDVTIPVWSQEYSQAVFDNIKSGMSYEDAMDKANEDLNVWHTGGIVGGKTDKFSKAINDLFQKQLKPDEIIGKLRLGEVVVEPTLGMKNFIPNMRNLISSISSIPQSNTVQNIRNYHFKDLTIKANNVTEFLDSINLLITAQG